MQGVRKVYIIGFMGSGKTTAGKKIAAALDYSFVDLDSEIERTTGTDISEIFSREGEAYFRRKESEILRNLPASGNIVVAAGGGAPCFGTNLSFMKSSGVVVYLKMSPPQLKSRLKGETAKRPLLKNLDETEILHFITNKLIEREPFYNQADIIADGFNPDILSIAEKIRNIFHSRP